jgi:hypothetical protein
MLLVIYSQQLIFAIIYKWEQKATVFVPEKSF